MVKLSSVEQLDTGRNQHQGKLDTAVIFSQDFQYKRGVHQYDQSIHHITKFKVTKHMGCK